MKRTHCRHLNVSDNVQLGLALVPIPTLPPDVIRMVNGGALVLNARARPSALNFKS